MISRHMPSAIRRTHKAGLARMVIRFSIAAILFGIGQPVWAQMSKGEPYYADGEIHCPDGSSALFRSAGEPPGEAAFKMACGFKGTGTPNAGSQASREQTATMNNAFELMEAMKSAPSSPNGLPMEAVWERAPGAPDAEFTDARPYFVSRWGGIVIRGRRNGNLIDRALAARHCGASDNPATDIYFIGEAPANICEGVSPVAAGKTVSFSSPITIKGWESRYTKLGTPSGWVVLEFLQSIDGVTHSGQAPATEKAASSWGVSSLGAFYRNEDGRHVFYAPGETVKLSDSFSFVVEPVIDAEELAAEAIGAAMRAMDNDPAVAEITGKKPRTPWQWSFLVVLGVPLALLGAAIYGVRRYLKGRREAQPSLPTPAILTNSAAPVGMDAPEHAPALAADKDVEEFYGMSRTSANYRRQGWFTLVGLAGPGLFFFSMLWWGEPTVVANGLELLIHFVVSKVLPLGLIAVGIAAAVANFKLGSKPETEVLWYRLDPVGLHILHEARKRATPGEIAQGSSAAGALIAWPAIRSVRLVPGAQPKVKIVRRSPGAIIDRTATLHAGQKSRGGARFEDRLSLWFAQESGGARLQDATQENPA